MAIKIKLKNSVTENAVPTGTHLPEVGELAVNANINSIGGYMRASDNSIVKIFGPGSVSTPAASTTVAGIAELATSAETTTGSDTARVCTPAGVKAVTDAERTTSNSTYLAKAGGTLTGVLQATAGSNSAPAIHFGDSDSGIYGGTNTVSLTAAGTQGLSLDSSAEVEIPTKLAINGAGKLSPLNVRGMTDGNLHIRAITDIHSGTGIGIDVLNDANNTIKDLAIRAANTVFKNASSESARLDSSGRFLVGHSSTQQIGGSDAYLQVNNNGLSISVARHTDNNGGAYLHFGKSRTGTSPGSTVVQSGDTLGVIDFAGADGTDINSVAAMISVKASGTIAGNRMPGELLFATTADSAGSVSPTTRLTIGSDGNATFAGNISVNGGSNSTQATFSGTASRGLKISTESVGAADEGVIFNAQASGTSASIKFQTNSATALTLAGNGGAATFAGDITVGGTKPTITLNDTNSESDFIIQNDDGVFAITDIDNNVGRLTIASNGQTTIQGNCDFSGGIDVIGESTIISNGSSQGLTIYKNSNIAAFIGHIGTGDEGYISLKNGGTETIGLNGETGAATFAGDITVSNTGPKLYLTDTNNSSDFSIRNDNGNLDFYDETNSASRLKIVSTGDATFSGHVNVGGTDGTVKVGGSDATLGLKLIYDQSGNTVSKIHANPSYTNTAALFHLACDGDAHPNQLVLKGDGKIGIGVAAPDEKLDIRDGDIILSSSSAGSNHRTSFIEFTGSYARINSLMNFGATTSSNYAAGWNITTRDWNGSAFSTLTPLSIQANGNIGLSETSPARKLHVTGGAHFGFAGTNGGAPYIGTTPALSVSTEGNSGGADIFADNALVHFGRGGGGPGAAGVTTTLFRVDLGGRVGIQGAPTKAILDVRASGGSNTYLTAVFGANEGTTTGTLTDAADKGARLGFHHYDNDEEAYAFVSCGGTSTANAINFGGGTSMMNAATSLGFYTAANNTTTTGTKRFTVESDGTVHKYFNGTTIQASFGGSGQVNGITAVPAMAATPFVVGRDTGSLRSAHFGGHLKFDSGYGIDFSARTTSGSSVDSNILDDYEAGEFTPTWYTQTSLITVNYHTQKGYYVKIGRMVYFQVYIRVADSNAITGGSGNLVIQGFPFTPQDATTHPNVAYGGLNVAYTNSWVGTTVDRGLISSSTTIAYVYVGQSSGTNVNAGAGNLGNGTQFRAYGSYITA